LLAQACPPAQALRSSLAQNIIPASIEGRSDAI
jgi:hypothetical protein